MIEKRIARKNEVLKRLGIRKGAWPGCRSRTKAKHVGKLLVAASKGKPLGSIADDDLVLKHTAGLRRADLFQP
jgi:hypothetical protein